MNNMKSESLDTVSKTSSHITEGLFFGARGNTKSIWE